MNRLHASLTLALTTALLALPVAAQQKGQAQVAKKLYCWSEGGRKVCGDALPASATDSARIELSAKSGLPTRQVDRTLTPMEAAAAAAQAELDRQAQFKASAQRMREHAMAESYATEADLRRAFNDRIELLDDTIKASELSIGSLRQSLVSLLRQAGEAELAGKPIPANLSGTIQRQHAELLRQQALLGVHRLNRNEVDVELESALKTYRDLKAPRSSGSSAGSV